MMDEFDIVVVGAGPHALAIVARILEPRPSSLYTDTELTRLPMLRSFTPKVDDLKILVLDKEGGWMTRWNRGFEGLEIEYLRSPMFFHPDPHAVDALLAFSSGTRSLEITGVVGREVSKHKRKQKRPIGIAERDRRDYFAPSTKLFQDFCEHLIERYKIGDIVQQTEVTNIAEIDVHIDGQCEKRMLIDHTHGQVRAKAVVLAVGPGKPNIPPYLHGPGWCHSSNLSIGSGDALCVIGGGLTAAQSVLIALKKYSHVIMVHRAPLRIKHFDLDLPWLGKYGNIQKMEYWQSEYPRRLEMIKTARGGGSITPRYHQMLKQLVKQGKLEIVLDSVLSASFDRKWIIELESSRKISADYIIAATGTLNDFNNLPVNVPFESSKGLPHLTTELQLSKTPLWVGSVYASLEIGPGAGNLIGAREVAERMVPSILSHLHREQVEEGRYQCLQCEVD